MISSPPVRFLASPSPPRHPLYPNSVSDVSLYSHSGFQWVLRLASRHYTYRYLTAVLSHVSFSFIFSSFLSNNWHLNDVSFYFRFFCFIKFQLLLSFDFYKFFFWQISLNAFCLVAIGSLQCSPFPSYPPHSTWPIKSFRTNAMVAGGSWFGEGGETLVVSLVNRWSAEYERNRTEGAGKSNGVWIGTAVALVITDTRPQHLKAFRLSLLRFRTLDAARLIYACSLYHRYKHMKPCCALCVYDANMQLMTALILIEMKNFNTYCHIIQLYLLNNVLVLCCSCSWRYWWCLDGCIELF